MKIDIEHLPQSKDLLQEMVFFLHESLQKTQSELQEFHQKYQRLLEQMRLARQQRFAASSEKNILQPDLFDEPGATEITEEVKEEIEEQPAVLLVQKKHPKRRPLPKDLPREEIIHDLCEAEKNCACCGNPLVRIGEEISEQLKYVPAKLSVVRHVRLKYACKPCQENVKIAPAPLLLLPKSIATPELVAQTIIAKYEDSLPLYRQENIWQRFGIDMPRSSLCGWLMKTAELCEPLYAEIKDIQVQQGYMQADETPVQVLNEAGRANEKKSYMWCYRALFNDLKPLVFFEYQETRQGKHPKHFLQGFKGYLQTDAYAGYDFCETEKDIVRIGCMAHARRPFAQLSKLSKTPGLSHEALRFFKDLYAIERRAREEKLNPEERYRLRHEHAPPVLAAFKIWLEKYLPQTSAASKLGEAMNYVLKNWELLTGYLKDGRLEIDNNFIENAIRPFALGRKNWLFAGSPKGARASAIFYSLIQTCKANDINPYDYFCQMLHQLPHCKSKEDYRQLLPIFIQLYK